MIEELNKLLMAALFGAGAVVAVVLLAGLVEHL